MRLSLSGATSFYVMTKCNVLQPLMNLMPDFEMRKNKLICTFLLFAMLAGAQAQVVLQRCDRANLWTGSNAISADSDDKKEGIASLQFSGSGTDWFRKTFSQTHTGIDESGYLALWLYVSDPGLFGGEGSIEISSSGGPDYDEYAWNLGALGLKSGWNDLILPVSEAVQLGTPDLDAINFFRVYQHLSGTIIAKIDDIRLLKTASPAGQVDPLNIPPVDNTTLDGKVMFGYQGWFFHPNDGSEYARWRHWGGDMSSPEDLTVDMFPDFREYEMDELFPTGNNFFTYDDGRTVRVYSAYKKKSVVRHMKWVRDYGLDGVFLQRFVTNTTNATLRRSRDTVTANIMDGCEKYGRVFANMWDISSFDPGRMDIIINDWKHLVDDLGITGSPNYLHHRGRPLVSIWGFSVREEFPESDLQELLDFFKSESTPEKYRATVMLGVDHDFHERPNWLDEMAQADVISPWSVGRFSDDNGHLSFLNKHVLPAQDWCDQHNVDFLPVIWPGFSWANLKNDTPNKRPRRGGNFFWTQATRVISGNAKSIYIAMFDEIDEATAMFKLAENDHQTPDQGYWLALDADGYDLPSDWYLRCAKLATEVVRGNTDNRTTLGTPPDGIDVFSVVTIAARCGSENGILELHYPQATAGQYYDFSIDGGVSYPYETPPGSDQLLVEGLATGVYHVWVRNGDNSHSTDLGPYTIFETGPGARVFGEDATCNAGGQISFLLDDLPYAGEVQVSVDSGATYDFTSTRGKWRDTIADLAPGAYSVWIRYADGSCATELTSIALENDTLPIAVYPMLDGDQSAPQTDTLFACPGSSLFLFGSPVGSLYEWNITGPNGFTANSRTVFVSNSLVKEMFGTYVFTYTRADGCERTMDFVLLEAADCDTNADEYELAHQPFSVYPNPAKDLITIKGVDVQSVHIFSLSGQLLLEKNNQDTIHIGTLTPGIYLVSVTDRYKRRFRERIAIL